MFSKLTNAAGPQASKSQKKTSLHDPEHSVRGVVFSCSASSNCPKRIMFRNCELQSARRMSRLADIQIHNLPSSKRKFALYNAQHTICRKTEHTTVRDAPRQTEVSRRGPCDFHPRGSEAQSHDIRMIVKRLDRECVANDRIHCMLWGSHQRNKCLQGTCPYLTREKIKRMREASSATITTSVSDLLFGAEYFTLH